MPDELDGDVGPEPDEAFDESVDELLDESLELLFESLELLDESLELDSEEPPVPAAAFALDDPRLSVL